MKSLIITVSLLASFPLFACPSMNQVDNTQREGFKLDMATDPNTTGIMHQHSENNEPLFKTAEQSSPMPQETKKGLMRH